jgi:cystathionine beta-lyase
MWVAEMDYPTAPAITAALHRAVDAETFGYPLDAAESGLADVLAAELGRRHGWRVHPDDVFLVADVMRGMTLALDTFSDRSDAVVITTPVYMPFFDVVKLSGRPQVHVPMVEVDPADWFLEHARVALSPGRPFRAPANQFARLNFATTTAILEESLDRMDKALRSR